MMDFGWIATFLLCSTTATQEEQNEQNHQTHSALGTFVEDAKRCALRLWKSVRRN